MIKQCKFGDGEAIARFSLPGGCLVYPEDTEQDLCIHHALRATPRNGMAILEDYTFGNRFEVFWTDRTGAKPYRLPTDFSTEY
mgnify:CR=1 FL=1